MADIQEFKGAVTGSLEKAGYAVYDTEIHEEFHNLKSQTPEIRNLVVESANKVDLFLVSVEKVM